MLEMIYKGMVKIDRLRKEWDESSEGHIAIHDQ